MMILMFRQRIRTARSEQRRWTYSSRIQLPTELPPQLMPVTMLLARLSLRGLCWVETPDMAMGCAAPTESRPRLPILMAVAGLSWPDEVCIGWAILIGWLPID